MTHNVSTLWPFLVPASPVACVRIPPPCLCPSGEKPPRKSNPSPSDCSYLETNSEDRPASIHGHGGRRGLGAAGSGVVADGDGAGGAGEAAGHGGRGGGEGGESSARWDPYICFSGNFTFWSFVLPRKS